MFAAVWVCCDYSVPLPFLLTFEMAAFRDLTRVRSLPAVSGAKANFRAHRVDFTTQLLNEQKKTVLRTKGTTYGRFDTCLHQRATAPIRAPQRKTNQRCLPTIPARSSFSHSNRRNICSSQYQDQGKEGLLLQQFMERPDSNRTSHDPTTTFQGDHHDGQIWSAHMTQG